MCPARRVRQIVQMWSASYLPLAAHNEGACCICHHIGQRLATGPPLELQRRLADEHVEPTNGLNPPLPRPTPQRRLIRVVDEVVDDATIKRLTLQRGLLNARPCADRRRID